MRIIFIGIHNKEGMTPLDSKSKSGQLIDRIIEKLPAYDCIKTNLYDDDEMPVNKNKPGLSLDWWRRINPLKDDILILLGKEVQNNMYYHYSREVYLKHPSVVWSKVNKEKYVSSTVAEINQLQD